MCQCAIVREKSLLEIIFGKVQDIRTKVILYATMTLLPQPQPNENGGSIKQQKYLTLPASFVC